MMQYRDTVITISRRLSPEMDDSSFIQMMVSQSASVDEICLLPLKELPINSATNIKVDKSDSIVKISPIHPSFINEANEYYSQYKTSLIHEPKPKKDMTALVHDVNAIFVLVFFAYILKARVIPIVRVMIAEIRNVYITETA